LALKYDRNENVMTCTKYGKRGETGNLKNKHLFVTGCNNYFTQSEFLRLQDNRPYTISVSAGPTSFLPDLNTFNRNFWKFNFPLSTCCGRIMIVTTKKITGSIDFITQVKSTGQFICPGYPTCLSYISLDLWCLTPLSFCWTY
jgi:hypothetical protein